MSSDAINRIDRLFGRNAATIPDAVHLRFVDGRTQTYGETLERARRLATGLVDAGVRRGDRVMIVMGNSGPLVELYVGCSLAGAIAVPVNTLSTPRELLATIADCTPAALFVQGQFIERIASEALTRDLRLKVVSEGSAIGDWQRYATLLGQGQPLAQPVSEDPEDAGIMIYSSGTTGKPKGILLRQRGVVENARMTNQVLGVRSDDMFLTILPLFSSFGFCFDLLIAALAGASTVVMPKFDQVEAAELIERCRVTVLAGVPTMFARIFDQDNLRDRDMSSLRLMDVGGGPVSDRLKHDLREVHGIEIVESYGLTEISPVASVQKPFAAQITGSCGPPLPGIEVKVVQPESDQPLPVNSRGELCFRCGTFMIEYWNKPDVTAQTLRGGWLHSGDIGIVDESGEIHIQDRLKDMIVSSGNNIYPKEVENALSEHDAVQSAAVIGVPDEVRGELVYAFVVMKSGATATEQELISHCAQLIGRQKLPRGITFVNDLPLTASGKIQRFQLRAMARQKTDQ